eukprot:2910993-Lingulodinium_polyedra.AAC.1
MNKTQSVTFSQKFVVPEPVSTTASVASCTERSLPSVRQGAWVHVEYRLPKQQPSVRSTRRSRAVRRAAAKDEGKEG